MRFATPLVIAACTFLLCLASASCSSDTPVDVDGGVDAAADAPDFCGQFTKVGDPCPMASPLVCFQDCDGGCKCVPGAGGPTWACTTDISCHPDAAPIDLDAQLVPDAIADDSGDDSGDDAGAADAAAAD